MLDYMIYILAFVVGSIVGLVYSYKQHGEPFVADAKFNVVAAVIAIAGWVLAFNSGNVILSAIGFVLGGFVMGERPGYGRKETALGLIIAIIAYLLLKFYGMM
ncbi:energy-converting hydrogenase subunit EhaL family protein [uncultured Methanobrevibacter sp.]|uniref:energy-converting hydrogenase subunit EhaL family protein n=1 Tax=uncultured Methanobrevibacter sp. TaxID=253161 RepID=UPI002603505D|nr:energy-converting hydrogenase subunit EhaL family protein [uncultured Methanobrevibacter sp.]